MIANHVIQADIIADLLAHGTLTALLGSVAEIRESSYQGADFAYPAVRLEVVSNTAITDRGENCDHSSLLFIVRAYAEGGSSRACNVIADVINTRLHRRNFQGTGWYTWIYNAGFNNPRRVQKKPVDGSSHLQRDSLSDRRLHSTGAIEEASWVNSKPSKAN